MMIMLYIWNSGDLECFQLIENSYTENIDYRIISGNDVYIRIIEILSDEVKCIISLRFNLYRMYNVDKNIVYGMIS